MAAVVLMLLYNGQRGSGHKQLFYWFYPAHVYLLYGASCLVYNAVEVILWQTFWQWMTIWSSAS